MQRREAEWVDKLISEGRYGEAGQRLRELYSQANSKTERDMVTQHARRYGLTVE